MHGTPPAPASSRSRSRSKPTGGQKHSQTRPRSWASTSSWHSGALDTGRGNWRRHRLVRRGLANQQSSPCRRAVSHANRRGEVHGRWLAQRPSRALSAPHLQAHPCGRGDHLMHQHVASGFHPSIRSKSHLPVLEESHYFTFLGLRCCTRRPPPCNNCHHREAVRRHPPIPNRILCPTTRTVAVSVTCCTLSSSSMWKQTTKMEDNPRGL